MAQRLLRPLKKRLVAARRPVVDFQRLLHLLTALNGAATPAAVRTTSSPQLIPSTPRCPRSPTHPGAHHLSPVPPCLLRPLAILIGAVGSTGCRCRGATVGVDEDEGPCTEDATIAEISSIVMACRVGVDEDAATGGGAGRGRSEDTFVAGGGAGCGCTGTP